MVGFQAVKLQPGQLIFGRKSAAEELKMSERQIRTCLEKLKKTQNVTIKTTNKFSIITIVNWPTYQQTEKQNDQQNDQHATSKRPASDHKQECKECKEEDILSGAQEVLEYLNQKTGKKFQKLGLIEARLNDGATVEQCKAVIDHKARDPGFKKKYLDHTTPFRPGNFDRYLNDAMAVESKTNKPFDINDLV